MVGFFKFIIILGREVVVWLDVICFIVVRFMYNILVLVGYCVFKLCFYLNIVFSKWE